MFIGGYNGDSKWFLSPNADRMKSVMERHRQWLITGIEAVRELVTAYDDGEGKECATGLTWADFSEYMEV